MRPPILTEIIAPIAPHGMRPCALPVSKRKAAAMWSAAREAAAMPVADMIRLGTAPRPTSQGLADMALAEDRAARAARARGDTATALAHERERDALCSLLDA